MRSPKSTPRLHALPLAVLGLVLSAQAPAADETAVARVVIDGHYDNAVGSSDAASQGVVRAELLRSRPTLRPGEVLEFVPGLVVTQHSGDGKANQYFLRGFNLDHGTDFATQVDGVPVNMPTHAHGQGYSDLSFLLPELIERIDYRKGPYFARNADFASAGSADLRYRTQLAAPLLQLTLGPEHYRRAVAAGSTAVGDGLHLLGAVETMDNDGPWTVPEGLRRRNGVLTLSGGGDAERWQVGVQTYTARWTATDQVPQRLLEAGTDAGRPFGRFDSLDPTDGGHTARHSLSGQWMRQRADNRTELSAYAMAYRLALYSNFTYALQRPDQGDQFSQRDARRVFGLQARHSIDHDLAGFGARSELGLQLRHDRIRVGLSDTVARHDLVATRDDRVHETMAGLYGQTAVELAPTLRAIAGLRLDRLDAQVDSLTLAANSGRTHGALWSPKLALVAGPFARTEFFVNAGRGLHSNDVRGATIRVDPRSGEPVDAVRPLVASRGAELGLRTEARPGLQSSLALWRLDSDSELVYVGDAGATEPAPASRRRGVEFNHRWIPSRHWLVDADLAWTHARFANGERIPNAVDRVATLGVTLRELGPWSASLQGRYLGSGALVEDNSARSTPSLTANLRVSRRLGTGPGRDTVLTLDAFNLFNRRVDDIQYVYTSRLPGEAAAVADRHVHPAEPRSLRLTLRLDL